MFLLLSLNRANRYVLYNLFNLSNIYLINISFIPNPGGNVFPESSSLSFPCTFSISRLRSVLWTGLYKLDFTPASFVLGKFSDTNSVFSLSVLLYWHPPIKKSPGLSEVLCFGFSTSALTIWNEIVIYSFIF